MKKSLFILAAAVALAACNPNTPVTLEEQKQAEFAKASYFEAFGTNTVPNVEGENHDQPFVMDSVRAEVIITGDNTLDVYLYQINFSSKMPITIDMVIPGVTYSRNADRITLSGDSLVPTMGGNPFDKYIVTALSGHITADSLVFSNGYGPYSDCTYAGAVSRMQEQNQ